MRQVRKAHWLGDAKAYSLEISNMLAQVAGRLAPPVLGFIPKKKVTWPKLCIPK
jgi:hypothetical protein